MSRYAKWLTGRRCPKCGSTEFRVEEDVKMTNTYIASGGVITFDGMVEDGDVISVTCFCSDCQHIWHPRREGFWGSYIEQEGGEE